MGCRRAVIRLIVALAAAVCAAVGGADETGFVPLFDGKSLEGWQGDLGGYDIVNGELRGKPRVCRNLMTKQEYGDFVLRLEFRLPPGGNSGIGIRAPGLKGVASEGMEIQILDDRHPRYESIEPWQAHGSIYGVVAAERDALKPAGEWNTQEVTARGTHVTVVVNGRKVVDADTAAFRDGRPAADGKHHPGLARTQGFVGLLGHGEEVQFRNIRIRPLEAAAVEPPLVLAPETTVIVRAPAPAPVPAADGAKPRPVPDNTGVAARLLQEYLRKCHGVAAGFEIVAEEKFAADAANGKQILAVGPTTWVEPDSLAGIGQDGFMIARRGDVVTICGGRGDVAAIQNRGTIHGAVDFLNRFAGVRFYMPGDLWTSLPVGRPVAVPVGFTLRSEPFVRHGSMTGMVGTAAGDWLVRNAANTRAGLAGTHFHNMWNVFPPAKYAATHPDIYPLVNGERSIPKDAKDQGWNPCFTNPRTIEVAEASAREFFAANPDFEWFSMGLQDGHKTCECPGCVAEFAKHEQEFVAAMKANNPERIVRTYAALVEPARDEKTLAKAIEIERKGPRSYAISQIQWRMIDALAARLEKSLPGKYVEALAYGISSFAPRQPLRPNAMLYAQIHLSDNVRGLMIPRPDGTLPVDAFVDASAAFGEHDWYQGSGFAAPRIYTDFWAKFLRHVKTKRKEMFVVHAEAYPNWGLDGPKLWVVSRLWWDPDQESDPLWRQFTADMFGAAQEPMRRYFATLEKWFQEQSVEPDWGGPAAAMKWNIQGYKQVFQRKPEDLGRMREARACLDEAARLVKTDEEKKRLDLFSRSFRLTEYLFELGTLGGDDAKVEEVKRYVREAIIPEPMTLFDAMRTEAELDRIITMVRKPAAAAAEPVKPATKPAAASLFEAPQAGLAAQAVTMEAAMLAASGRPDEARKRIEKAIESGEVRESLGRSSLARLHASRGDSAAALEALGAAVAAGFDDAITLAKDPDLRSIRDSPRFRELAAVVGERAQAAVRARKPRPVKDGVATVAEENTLWVPHVGRFIVAHEFPPADPRAEISRRPGPVGDLLRQWRSEGFAAGLHGVLYDNRDEGHSAMDVSAFPELARIEYSEAAKKARTSLHGLGELHRGLQALFLHGRPEDPVPMIGNSSVAQTQGPFWRSMPRLAMANGALATLLADQYVNNMIYVYPEHRDHDAEADGGHGDVYPANVPYLVTSQGSSGSDKAFLDAIAATMAAFRPQTWKKLVDRSLVAPTVQMLLRASRKPVKGRDDYLSGVAHPTVFDAATLDVERMVRMAHEMRPEDVPALVRIAVEEEYLGRPGIDYFEAGPAEKLFDTVSAVGRVARSARYRRRMVASVAGSRDPNERKLSFTWRLLRGDPDRVRIEPLDADGTRAEILVDWHPRAVHRGGELPCARVDVGVFADNGANLSAPAFLTWYFPPNELRTYEEVPAAAATDRLDEVNGDSPLRIAAIERLPADRRDSYADPMIVTPAAWTDTYRYDDRGDLLGWTRARDGATERFTEDGWLVTKTAAAGDAGKARPVRYLRTQRGPDAWPVLQEAVVESAGP